MGSSEFVTLRSVRGGSCKERFADFVRRSAQALADHAEDYVPDTVLTGEDEQVLWLVVSSNGVSTVKTEFTSFNRK